MKIARITLFISLPVLWLLTGCESEKKYPPAGYLPNIPMATEKLEAQYFWVPQNKISSAYWSDASYVKVTLIDFETRNLYGDGYLNMTGTYSGKSSFNGGKDPQLTLKAGYDDEYLYILAEWKDTTANASFMSWLWDGPTDIRKDDTSTGWTSQRNHDNITLLFDKESSSGKDAWRWSLAYTAPFDLALNLDADENGVLADFQKPYSRNAANESSRVGPNYEWNGERMEVTMPDGNIKLLDPAYYLIDGKVMEMPGNVAQGQQIFNSTADCSFCHGHNGDGESEFGDGGRLNDVFTNRYTRDGLVNFIGSSDHEGSGDQYWGKIKNNLENVENLLTFMRAIAGTPGNILSKPESENILALNNLQVGGIEKQNSYYKVLFKRKLVTENSEDVSFFPEKTYRLDVHLSDNDEINYIGASGIELIFKGKAL